MFMDLVSHQHHLETFRMEDCKTVIEVDYPSRGDAAESAVWSGIEITIARLFEVWI